MSKERFHLNSLIHPSTLLGEGRSPNFSGSSPIAILDCPGRWGGWGVGGREQ
ncbi:MAG: hypothetical protein MUF49_20235 [Oculatellaceae cyanobacterium Prado106]|nr:hypothetical protein [Oculatellaceae cyanobacterium Prado106]